MADEKILLVEKKNGVLTITLNRPDKLNAFNDELTFGFQDALKSAEKDPDVKVIIITGAGRGFCAGQDLQTRMMNQEQGIRPSLGDSIRRRYNPLFTKIRRMEKPFIAAVNGVAAGAGMSLALICDMRIASEEATFIQSFSKVGLVPDSGSTFMLPRLIGYTKAFELMVTADKLTAKDALELGLLNKVVPADKVLSEAVALAEKLALDPVKAYGLTKRALNEVVFPDLDLLLEQEAMLQEIAGKSDDFEEGVKAFVEKRAAVYKGK
jgi:2-(1,2-epoxy-1,2-dihydrophenyl)acetyl-CoA isomerase